MSTYGITAYNLADSHEAAMARNMYSAGTELLDTTFPNISNYYYDIAIEYAGGGFLTMTRVWIESPPTEAAQIHISNDGSAPSGTIGNSFDLRPTQYATLAPYTAIGFKRASVRLVIQDGQVVWIVDGYQTETYSTNSQTGFYDSSNDNAELTIVQTTIPVTFNDDTPWIFQTWLDTPLLNYSPPQSFLDGLTKESNYYLSFYTSKINGDTASNALRIYFKEDPGIIHIRTFYLSGSGSNGWLISWENPDEEDVAWNYILSNENGASPDWSMTGGSGGWAHDMYEYDSSRDARNGYLIQSPYWLFIFESTVPISFNGLEYVDPTPPPEPEVEYYLDKDGFTMEFGARPTRESNHHVPEFNDINNYYLTKEYQPVIRFTSPVDGEEYTVNTLILADYQVVIPTYDVKTGATLPELWECGYEVKVIPKNTNTVTSQSYLQGARMIIASPIEAVNITNATYEDMTSVASENYISLGLLVEYFRRTNPAFSSNDVYTEIFYDFYELGTPHIVGTKSVDFSSLYGSGIDATKSDGKGDEGHSWNPLPDKDDYDNNEYQGDDTDTTPLEEPNIQPYNLFLKTYIVSAGDVDALANELTTTDSSVFNEILEGLKLFGANPMNALIDLRLYPFDVAAFTGTSAESRKNIVLGRYDTHVAGFPFPDHPLCSLYLGGIKIDEVYNSFLDYEPYTMMRLYIPYIGTIDLPPSIYMGHIVGVNLIVDFFTGACRAVIFSDGIAMSYQDGIIGTSIAMTGDNASEYANSIVGNLVGAVGSAAGAVVLTVTGRPDKGITSLVGAVSDLFDMSLSINDILFQLAGSASPNIGQWMPLKCHIMIARPQLNFENSLDYNMYAANVGFATSYGSQIKNLHNHGIYYGVLAEHIAYGDGTEAVPTTKEVEMIKQALNNGFFIGMSY